MTKEQCSKLISEHLHLLGSEYLDRRSGGKCILKKLDFSENPQKKGKYIVVCELVVCTAEFSGSKTIVSLDTFLNSGRFQKIRAGSI